jgi:hypothetical protein
MVLTHSRAPEKATQVLQQEQAETQEVQESTQQLAKTLSWSDLP